MVDRLRSWLNELPNDWLATNDDLDVRPQASAAADVAASNVGTVENRKTESLLLPDLKDSMRFFPVESTPIQCQPITSAPEQGEHNEQAYEGSVVCVNQDEADDQSIDTIQDLDILKEETEQV